MIVDGYHIPVLLEKSLEQLITNPDGIYIDATFGGGGHSKAILERLGENGHLFGVDRDLDALSNCSIQDKRFTFVRSDFRYISHFMNYWGIDKVDGILADLGVSSHHLDEAERGFSFRFDAPIDMRMNQAGGMTALELITASTTEELANILYNYGEVRSSRKIASKIKEAAEAGMLSTIQSLLDVLRPIIPPHDKKGLARLFQALRIAVNDEIEALRELLENGRSLLKKGGRFSIITYHSLEDRPVKNIFKFGNIAGERIVDQYGVLTTDFLPLMPKPTFPSLEEIELNPRARSAKLRTGVRL